MSEPQSRTRVLIVTFAEGIGGPQQHVAALCGHAALREHCALRVWHVPDRYRGMGGKWRLWRELRARLAAQPVDWVYLNLDLSLAFWMCLCLRLGGMQRVLLHAHAAEFGSPRAGWRQDLFRRAVARWSRHALAVSPEAARAMFGARADVEIMPSLIDFDALHAAAAAASAAPRAGFVFGFVGRLVREKNLQVAIRALSLLVARGAAAEIVVVGEGEAGAEWQALARSLDVADRVHFVGALASPAPAYAHRFDALLLPSLREGQARVLAEAQAFGLPVLASVGIPGSAWLWPDSRSQAELPVRDPQAWSVAMQRLIDSHPSRAGWPALAEVNRQPHALARGGARLLQLWRTGLHPAQIPALAERKAQAAAQEPRP